MQSERKDFNLPYAEKLIENKKLITASVKKKDLKN
jgi:hypothetical protein